MAGIDFWFSIGSTYTYLTMMRLDAVEAERGVTLNLRPFNVRTVVQAQNNIPFAGKPVKMAYMWRDIERRAGRYAIPVSVPAPYPVPELTIANQLALLGLGEGWGRTYVMETYRRWFQHGEPPGEAESLSHALAHVGEPGGDVLDRARAPEIEAALAAETEHAMEIGVFGAPTFVVDGEVFWGDDRLDDAIEWARRAD